MTTFPLLRLPIHMTYLVYLWQFSPLLARTYIRLALATCRLTKVAPSMLLHPLDFIDAEDDAEMQFFPGMSVPREEKMELLDEVLAQLSAGYRLVPLREHAADVLGRLGVQIPAAQRIAFCRAARDRGGCLGLISTEEDSGDASSSCAVVVDRDRGVGIRDPGRRY